MTHAGPDPFADLAVPTLHATIRHHALTRPTALALRFGERRHDYAALDALTDRVAASLVRDGIQPGDRLLFLGRNSDAIPILTLGANKAGIVPVPLNWRLAPAEIAALAADAGARMVFFEPEFAEAVAALVQSSPAIVSRHADDLLGESDWLSASGTGFDRQDDPRSIAIQVYTSGTTGRPKGVMLSHRSLLGINTLRSTLSWDRWNADDVTLAATPLGHIAAYGMLARALFFGGGAIIHPTFTVDGTLDAIEADGVSKLALVPTAIKMILDHPRARSIDYSRIDTIIYGSAPITLPLLREALSIFRCRFAQSYGMSETSGTTVALPPEDHDPAGNRRMTGAGKALPATQLIVTDSEGKTLPAGEVGEIRIRSIANMVGYWNQPEETARTLCPGNWIRTGDAGFLDEEGYLFVRGRIKEMIITGAENVYPAEVEQVVAAHPDVAEVAVIGLPDAHWGEAVTAVIVVRPGAAHDAAAITRWARSRLAGYKTPKAIHFVTRLPLNTLGKVDKRALREAMSSEKCQTAPSSAGLQIPARRLTDNRT
ncbi:long-chain-fatty-acid--CoA ligase [Rhizorhabdus argentea]|uniref:long-chain-fatty-acid--CoA ligase n=1 Tax=Rhizorhabdus argentea TaxID=1387174 RepID=UPI0030EEF0E8